MSLVPLLVVTTVGGLVALAAGRWGQGGRIGTLVGLAALVVALLVALTLPSATPSTPATVTALSRPIDATLRATPYVRLVAILWCGYGLLLAGLAAITGRVPALAGATLVGLAAGVVALGSADLLVAGVAAIVAGVGGLLVSAPEIHEGPGGIRGGDPRLRRPRAAGPLVGGAAIAGVAARELRSLVVAGVAVLGGVVLVAAIAGRTSVSEGAAAGLAQVAPVVGIAAMAIAFGVALRTGAIPFHLWAARVADVAPAAALPLLLAWTPLALTAVAVAAWDARVAPLGLPLDAERALLVAVAALTLGAGAVAASIQDDLEHVVGYLVIADGGLVLLGLASADPATVAPSLAWLLILAVSKSALGAWATAIPSRFGTRQLSELHGWARQAPLLALAFVLTASATFGLPGWLAWEIRRTLPTAAAGDLVGLLLWLVTLLALVPYARVLGAGLGRRIGAVAEAPSERPTGRLGAMRPATRAGIATALLRANRAPIVSSLVVVAALLAALLASGGLGIRAAASAAPPPIAGLSPE
jgi:NADH:ubiquinone oxidoreductase subunit 2 (subunit N)